MPSLSRTPSRPTAAPPSQDGFWRLSQINRTSIVILIESGLVSRPLAGQAAAGIQEVIADQGRSGAKCSGDYLEFDALRVKAAGPEALTPKRMKLVGVRR